jgi:hypothetical protein
VAVGFCALRQPHSPFGVVKTPGYECRIGACSGRCVAVRHRHRCVASQQQRKRGVCDGG